MLFSTARGSTPERTLAAMDCATSSGPGRRNASPSLDAVSHAARRITRNTIPRRRPRIVELLPDHFFDLDLELALHHARERRDVAVVGVAGAREVHAELALHPAGARAHDDHPVAQAHRLAHVVGDEH